MKLNWKAYAVLGGVFVLSVTTVLLVPSGENLIAAAFAAPGVLSLLAAMFQLMRDEADYEKRMEAQRREFQFTLGAASHMANMAFDKHAEFCEKYMQELHEAVRTLWREGDTPAAIDHANRLSLLRQEHAVWLTDRINSGLGEFESTLRRLGADAHFVRTTAGDPGYAEHRALSIDRNHDLFARILGIRSQENVNEESMVDALKTTVRGILGIEELTRLREHLVKQAINAISA